MADKLTASRLQDDDAEKLIHDLTERLEGLEQQNRDLQDQLADERATSQGLLNGQEHFRTIVNSEPGCVKLLDRDCRVLSMNPAGVAIVEADNAEQVIGASIFGLIDQEDHAAFEDLNDRVFAGESGTMEYRITGFHGRRYHLETHAAPLRDANGQVVAHLGITHDITSRKRDQEELINYRDHLEELVAQRTEELGHSREATLRAERLASLGTLAAGVSHELNNPLGTIRLAAEFALGSTDTESVQRALNGICEDVERCGRIVTSVLKFNREEPSDKWPLCLNGVIRLARDRTRSVADEAGVRVELDLDESIDEILGNETELERVLINVIDNGIRATSNRGRVRVQTRQNDDQVICQVQDDGCGMTTDQLKRVFDPFFTTRLECGGTGLGLSVSHGIVQDHAGTIEIESTVDVGSTVSFSLPTASR